MLTDQAIDDACAQAGIGRRTLESRQRDPDTVRRREIVAWLLHYAHGWTQKEVSLAIKRTLRQTQSLLRNHRVASYSIRSKS
jgi:hypothetical protein